MIENGKVYVLTTFQPCTTKEALRKNLNATVMRLSATTCTLASIAGFHRDATFKNLKLECEMLRGDILVLKREIATHYDEHRC